MDERVVFGLYQSCEKRGVLDVCLYLSGEAGGVLAHNVEWEGGCYVCVR